MNERDIKMMFSRERDAKQLRDICRDTSAANPELLVTGFFMFGRFPYVEYSQTIGCDQVIDNVFSGYWQAGEFRLLSPAQLALADSDEDDEDVVAAEIEVQLRKSSS